MKSSLAEARGPPGEGRGDRPRPNGGPCAHETGRGQEVLHGIAPPRRPKGGRAAAAREGGRTRATRYGLRAMIPSELDAHARGATAGPAGGHARLERRFTDRTLSGSSPRRKGRGLRVRLTLWARVRRPGGVPPTVRSRTHPQLRSEAVPEAGTAESAAERLPLGKRSGTDPISCVCVRVAVTTRGGQGRVRVASAQAADPTNEATPPQQ